MNSGEHNDFLTSRMTRKRGLPDENEGTLSLSMDELNEDLLETVISQLHTSAVFRVTSVCKRWKSVIASQSFKLSCSLVPFRDPWFYMVDQNVNKSVIFDSAEGNWKNLHHPSFLQKNSKCSYLPVAASGGLVCFRNESGKFVICNPVTGSYRQLPPLEQVLENQSLLAISMRSYSTHNPSYKLVLVFGEFPKFSYKIYNSISGCWEQEIELNRKVDDSVANNSNEDNPVYFLSKTGNLVSTNMQRSPSKQYSAVNITKNGEELVYFLSSSGTVVSCNITHNIFSEYPRLLPAFFEYSIDVVECKGEILVVVLSEFFESASLRLWRFEESKGSWQQVAVMPPAMSHEMYGRNMDINCAGGANGKILICLNSGEFFSHISCDVARNQWVELPKSLKNEESVEFTSAFSFEPRIEASGLGKSLKLAQSKYSLEVIFYVYGHEV
ncbi:hypothetical protein ACFE04_018769 [Oxalis oulophora]